MDDLTIAVVTVAAELGMTPDQLVAKLDPNDILVGAAGIRVLETATASRLIDEHHRAQTRTRQRDIARKERLAEASRRARATIRGGIPATSDDPLADMLAIDGIPPRIQAAEHRLDAWLAGRSTGGRISPPTTKAR